MSSASLPIPGPRGWPVVGSMFDLREDPLAFFTDLHHRYGEAASFQVMGTRLSLFFHPRAVKQILVDDARNYTNREANPELRMLVGDGLLGIDGAEHRTQRRIVQPAFHRSRIESYASTMVEHTERMLADWRPHAELDVHQEMSRLTLRIAGKTLFGADLDSEADAIGLAFYHAARFVDRKSFILSRIPLDLPFLPYGKYVRARRHLDAIVESIIERRRASGEDRGDVLSMLLATRDDAGEPLDDRRVRDHVLTFLAAGHATTANALGWTFYLLAQYPEARAKAIDEATSVLGGRAPTVADLPRLPYLDMVLKESLRLYPPAWVQARHVIDDCVIDGYRVAAGSFFLVSQWVTHRRADLWPDPERFVPERWASPATGDPSSGLAYFPFGAGPRICIGMPFALMEARLVLATILQRFQPDLVPGHRVVARPLIILEPVNGIRMRLTPVAAREPVPSLSG